MAAAQVAGDGLRDAARREDGAMVVQDMYTAYEQGMQRVLEYLGNEHPQYGAALTYQQRLAENIAAARLYGDTETRRAERAQLVEHINRIAVHVGGPMLRGAVRPLTGGPTRAGLTSGARDVDTDKPHRSFGRGALRHRTSNDSRARTRAPVAARLPQSPEPLAEYRLKRMVFIRNFVAGGCASAVGLYMLLPAVRLILGAGTVSGVGWALIMGSLVLLVGIGLWWEAYECRDLRVRVYADRLIYQRNGQTKTYFWQDITAVSKWRSEPRSGLKFKHPRTVHRSPSPMMYMICCDRTDRALILDRDLLHRDQLEETIQQHVTTRLLPRYTATYRAGKKVEFGPKVWINQQHVGFGGKTISWRHIERAESTDAELRLHLWHEIQPLKMVLSSRTKNYFLFVALVNRVISER